MAAAASSSSSSSSSYHSSSVHSGEESTAEGKAPAGVLVSSAFFRPFKSHRHPATTVPSTPPQIQMIGFLQSSISTAAEKWSRLLHCLASQNPFLRNVLSLSSHLRTFLQIPCRDFRSLNTVSSLSFAAILPGDTVAGIVVSNGIQNFLNIYNTLLVVRIVLTWFPNAPPAIVSPLSTICDPYLNIFRGLIPPLGGTLDLSPILAFLVLNAFTSTAAALPAELPTTGVSLETLHHTRFSGATTSQEKWMRRLSGNKSKRSGSVQ